MAAANQTLTITSAAVEPNQPIPRQYTAEGRNVSPPLAWSNPPADTKQWALIVDDPDAPRLEPWVHWVIYNIPAQVKGLPEAVPPAERVAAPAGCIQGQNTWGRIGYGGPEPPHGHGIHHYYFHLYALDAELNLPPGADKKKLLDAMQGHVIAQARLVGTFER